METKVAFRAAELESEDPQLLALLGSSHFVRERSTEELETYHDRIRQAVVASLDPAAVKDYHFRLAVALEAHGQTPDKETLAVHFREGGDLERAAGYAAEAASQATQALAFDRAVRLYRLALERPDSTQLSVPQLQMRLGDSLSNLGRGDEAAQAYLAGGEKATDPVTRLELRRRAAEQLLLSGQVDAGLSVLRE